MLRALLLRRRALHAEVASAGHVEREVRAALRPRARPRRRGRRLRGTPGVPRVGRAPRGAGAQAVLPEPSGTCWGCDIGYREARRAYGSDATFVREAPGQPGIGTTIIGAP